MMLFVVLFPIVSALVIALLSRKGERAMGLFTVCSTALTLAVMLLCAFTRSGETVTLPIVSLSFTLDGFRCIYGTIVCFMWFVSAMLSPQYFLHHHNLGRYYAFFLLCQGFTAGVFLSAELYTTFLFFELMSIGSYVWVAQEETEGALHAGKTYLAIAVLGGLVTLMGLFLLEHLTGTLVIAQLGEACAAVTNRSALWAAAVCILVGFGAKAGMFPLHIWLPKAHPVAPAPASALLSGIIAKVGVVGIIRTVYFLVGAEHLRGTWVQYAWLTLGMLTVFLGSFMGCTEKVLKKRLAYSSISQISYILLGIFILTPAGLVGALLQLIFHAIAKVGMFLTAGSAIYLDDVTTMDRFRGLGRRMPVTLASFALLSLSLVGLPPFGGFHSKWQLALAGLDGLSGAVAYLLPAVLLVSALMTAGYLFPPVMQAFFPGENAPKEPRIREPLALVLPLAVLGVLGFVLGLFGDSVVAAVQSIVSTML